MCGMILDEDEWKESIRKQMEEEINRRVREALETPNSERQEKHLQQKICKQQQQLQELERHNAHIELDLSEKEHEFQRTQKWKAMQAKHRIRRLMTQSQLDFTNSLQASLKHDYFNGELAATACGDNPYSSLFPLHTSDSVKNFGYYAKISDKAQNHFGKLSMAERHEFFYAFTRNGFREALKTGRLPDGSNLDEMGDGKYVDKYGIVRDQHGPFWPSDFGPLFPSPVLNRLSQTAPELLTYELPGLYFAAFCSF